MRQFTAALEHAERMHLAERRDHALDTYYAMAGGDALTKHLRALAPKR